MFAPGFLADAAILLVGKYRTFPCPGEFSAPARALSARRAEWHRPL